MKYIIIDSQGIEVPIIFSELQSHREVAGDRPVISAGLCQFSVEENVIGSNLSVRCWGYSVTLKGQSSRGDVDERIILEQNEFQS